MLQERRGQWRNAGGDVGERRVLEVENLAACARLDDRLHRAVPGDRHGIDGICEELPWMQHHPASAGDMALAQVTGGPLLRRRKMTASDPDGPMPSGPKSPSSFYG